MKYNNKEREQKFIEYLDKNEKHVLLVRFVFSQDYLRVESFAVIYLALHKNKFTEIVKFDASQFEKVNMHLLYNKGMKKQHLDKEKSWETILEFIQKIRDNWHDYWIKFNNIL